MITKISENGPAIQPTLGSETNTEQAHADMSSIFGNSPNFMENASKLGDRSTSIKESIKGLSQKGDVQESSNTSMNVDDRIKLCINNDINVAIAMANAANRNGPIMGNFVSFDNAKTYLNNAFESISGALNKLQESLGETEIKDKSPEQKLLSSITGMLGRYIPGESIGSLSDDDPKNFIKKEGEKKEGEKKSHKLCSIKNEINDMLEDKNGQYTVGQCIEKIKILMNGKKETPGLISILDEQKPAEPLKASDQPSEADTTKDGAKKTETEGTTQNIAIQRTQDFQTIQVLCGTNDLAQTLKEISTKAKETLDKISTKAEKTPDEIVTETKNKKIKELAGDFLKNLNKTGLNTEKQLEIVEKLRKNDFFYEYSWRDLDESITDVLVSFLENDNEKALMRSLIEADLLASREATGSADGIKSGIRGRTAAKDISKRIADRDTPEENFYCLSYDDDSGSNKKALEGRFTKTTKDLISAMRENKAFAHSFRPKQFANGNMIDSKRLEIINNPIKYINELQNTLDIFQKATFNEIPNFAEKLSKCCDKDEVLSKGFKDIMEEHKKIGDITDEKDKASAKKALMAKYIEVFRVFLENHKSKFQISIEESNGTAITEKILEHPISKNGNKNIATLVKKNQDDDKYESKTNLAAAMQNQGLRTICSVSGTTTDIAATAWAINGENTKGALSQLNTFIKTDCQDFSKLKNEFKDLFLSIALYMQSGQYHSAAEVLSGLCCSAQTLIEPTTTTIEIQNGRPEPYSTLMEAFQKNPLGFFPNGSEKNDTDANQATA